MRIDIAVFDGVDEMDAIGPLEVFRNAESAGADLHAQLVTLTRTAGVTGSHGLCFTPDAVYSPGASALLMPGGGWNDRSEHGAWAEAQRGDWLDQIRTAQESGVVLTGVCTGVMLLAQAGVIGARRATTHFRACDELAATGATVVGQRVVDDGDLVTCGGVTSGLDLALWLVEREFSAELADGIAEEMEWPRTRPLSEGLTAT
jgi:transcriptional regulator GlxA family with amidase domain